MLAHRNKDKNIVNLLDYIKKDVPLSIIMCDSMVNYQESLTHDELKAMNTIVGYTLDKYSLKATWRLIPLAWNKWQILARDKTAMDTLAESLRQKLSTPEAKAYFATDPELTRMEQASDAADDLIRAEYGRVPSLQDNLHSFAITMVPDSIRQLRRLRGNHPFLYKLSKEYKSEDFLILLNLELMAVDFNEKLKTVVHEVCTT